MKQHLPDITNEHKAPFASSLPFVGMEYVELVIKIQNMFLPAKGDFLVNIDDPNQKGIHMSRLYVQATQDFEANEFSGKLMEQVLEKNLASQEGISSTSVASISFDLPIKQPALLSANAGWRHYPITIRSTLSEGIVSHQVLFELTYSSTCPCSAALSRQLLQQNIDASFDSDTISKKDLLHWIIQEKNQSASPHSQRSTALISLDMETPSIERITQLIQTLETQLATRVQTAIKREDEQEFARLNGTNLMFCEDAARKLKQALQMEPDIESFRVDVSHKESLHPHDAVATATSD